jgi:hypothetical protein
VSYTDLRDFEAEYTHVSDVYGVTVQVEKLGGGEVGREYAGKWRYIVTDTESGAEVTRGQDFETGMPYTHERAAEEIAELTAGEE